MKRVLAVILALCMAFSICACGSKSDSGSKGKESSSSASSSSKVEKDDDYYENIAMKAVYNEIKRKYKAADADSTKYTVNKIEKESKYTTVYGKLHLYDKYGKATTGNSDKSGSYIRTFEVKINNSTGSVSNCKVK